MIEVVTGQVLGTEILKALSIHTERVTAITLICSVNDVARVIVEIMVPKDKTEELTQILERYEVVERNKDGIKPNPLPPGGGL